MKIQYILLIIVFIVGSLYVFAKYFIFRIGDAVDAKISNSYFHHSMKHTIVYAPMGNWFELGYEELDADPKTFVPLSEDIGKDASAVFWKGIKQDVDQGSFRVHDGIVCDRNYVYSTSSVFDKLLQVPGAIPATYEKFDTGVDSWNRYWFRDGQHYFYEDKMIEADYASFKRINHTIAIDANFIYAIVHKEIADSLHTKTVREVIRKGERMKGEVVSVNSNYVRIGNTIVCSNWRNEYEAVPFEVIHSIRIIDERNIGVNDELISDGKIIKGVDLASFEVLSRDFFKDKSHVYYDGNLIQDADAREFEIISETYSKDKKHVYYKNEIVDGANPSTFTYDYPTDTGVDQGKRFKNGKRL